jgi:hypothetical protein
MMQMMMMMMMMMMGWWMMDDGWWMNDGLGQSKCSDCPVGRYSVKVIFCQACQAAGKQAGILVIHFHCSWNCVRWMKLVQAFVWIVLLASTLIAKALPNGIINLVPLYPLPPSCLLDQQTIV